MHVRCIPAQVIRAHTHTHTHTLTHTHTPGGPDGNLHERTSLLALHKPQVTHWPLAWVARCVRDHKAATHDACNVKLAPPPLHNRGVREKRWTRGLAMSWIGTSNLSLANLKLEETWRFVDFLSVIFTLSCSAVLADVLNLRRSDHHSGAEPVGSQLPSETSLVS